MTIRLKDVYQLDTLNLGNGLKCQYQVLWGRLGHKVIFTKNTITHACCIA